MFGNFLKCSDYRTSTFSTFKNKSLSMLITSWKLLEKYLEKQMVQMTVGVQSGELMLE